MGASVSTNIAKIATTAIANVSSNIVQNSNISSNMSQIISISDIKGDVVISGNTFKQTANINMESLFSALSTQQAQQAIATQVAQEAKSLTSGFNLGQISESQNMMDMLMSATVNIVNTVGQTCQSASTQHQQITVERVQGSVTISNNVFDQMFSILQKCVQNTVTTNSTIQDMQLKLTQASSASSQGVNLTELAFIGMLMFGLPIVGTVVIGTKIIKHIAVILMLLGFGLLIMYYQKVTYDVEFLSFSSFIEETKCESLRMLVSYDYDTIEEAAAYCQSNSKCWAFDWKGINIASDGTYTVLPKPRTVFYSSVQNTCQKIIKPDKVSTIKPHSNGFTPATPSVINTSGFKIVKRTSWLLYAGLGCIITSILCFKLEPTKQPVYESKMK